MPTNGIIRVKRWLGFVACAIVLCLSAAPLAGAAASGAPLSLVTMARAGSSSDVYLLYSDLSGGCTGPRCLRLYRTTISATRQTRETIPALSRGGDLGGTTLNQLAFANEEDGYVVASTLRESTLFATTNGARSWHRVETLKGTMTLVVTANQVFTKTVSCSLRTGDCGQTVIRRSSLLVKSWMTLPLLWRSGNPKRGVLYGPSLAAYGNDVWELETANDAEYLWTSTNEGRTFTSEREPFAALASINGCLVTPTSLSSLWAECPTGMQVSFWHSSDGGNDWTAVKQTQFSGTGGGAFDPFSPSVAYLDYGAVSTATSHRDLIRISDDGSRATPVGELFCDDVSAMVFVNSLQGLAACTTNVMNTSITDLLRTLNGGESWTRVSLPSS